MRAGIGLDIGSTAMRVAAIRSTKSGPILHQYESRQLSSDISDEIPDPEEITAAVKSLVKSSKLPKAPVSVGLVNQRMVAREVEIPWVPAKDLASALPLLVADLLPMPVEESVLDFLPFQEVIEDDGGRLLRGLLVAANEELVTSAVEAVERAGVHVDRVDFSPLGALHSVCSPVSGDVEAVVDVGAHTTCLVVHEGNRPSFMRVMARGGADTTQALAAHLAVEENVAEAWKVALAQMWPTMTPADQQLTHSALDAASEPLIDEIRSSINFFHTNTGARVTRLWLIGGAGAQYGFDYQLRDALHMEVRRGLPVQRLAGSDIPLDTLATQEPAMATAIGLALGVAA